MSFDRFHRIPVIGAFALRPRLLIALVTGMIVFAALPQDWRPVTRLIVSWDLTAALYLALAVAMMAGSDNRRIRARAAKQDEGGPAILLLTICGAGASLAAIVHELAIAKTLSAHAGWAVGLGAATVLLSWLFMQTSFAIHYAHEYYKYEKEGGGLEFPDDFHAPDYWDFVYFSFVIGAAAATADINLTSRRMRRIVTLQCVAVFFFNTSILALAINIGAGLAS